MAKRNLQFTAVLTINSRARAFAEQSSAVAEQVVRDVVARAAELARENVRPGKGPSPHSGPFKWGHNYPYEDLGNLAEHVLEGIWLQGFLTEGSVFTDLDYGSYLEVGWRQRGKKPAFFRYPWLKPAFMEAMKLLPAMAAERFRTQLQDLDEDTFESGEALEAWADAAQRWADSVANVKGKTASPEYTTAPATHRKRTRINLESIKNPRARGRPRDPDLGEILPAERGRIRKERAQKRRYERNAEKFDKQIIERSTRSGDQSTRGQLNVEDVQRIERENQKKREVRELKGIGRRKSNAERRFDETTRQIAEQKKKLDEVNKELLEMGPIKPPKRKRKKKP